MPVPHPADALTLASVNLVSALVQEASRMSESELGAVLDELPSGETFELPDEIYAGIFPPGEPDENARELCYLMAKQHRCKIRRAPSGIRFIKA